MPTILDTLNIATCSVSYGKEASFAGRFASASITVTPKAIGVSQLRLNWAATGDIFTSFTDSTIADSGTTGIIVLPQTGQDGFRLGTTAFKNWYYEAVITAVTIDGQALSRVYRFQIPSGTTSLDLDTLDEDGVVTALPATAPAPVVNSINGQSGTVTLDVVGQSALVMTAVKTAAYTAAKNELVRVDASSAPVTVTLPTAPSDKSRVTVKKIDTSTNPVTVACAGSDVFNKAGGNTSLTLLLPNQALTMQYDTASAIWVISGGDVPLSQLDARYPTAASIAATYVAFVKSDGTPLTGKKVLIKLTADQTDIQDIVVVNA